MCLITCFIIFTCLCGIGSWAFHDYIDRKKEEETSSNATGVADLRYRAQYWPWSAVLKVQVVSGQFDESSILALVDAAGIGGVGEWRPTSPKSRTGDYGRFQIIDGVTDPVTWAAEIE